MTAPPAPPEKEEFSWRELNILCMVTDETIPVNCVLEAVGGEEFFTLRRKLRRMADGVIGATVPGADPDVQQQATQEERSLLLRCRDELAYISAAECLEQAWSCRADAILAELTARFPFETFPHEDSHD